MAGTETMELHEYVDILRRRRGPLITTFVAILLASVIIAYSLPKAYTSDVTIQIERQSIPSEARDQDRGAYMAAWVQTISQRVLTDDSLWRVAQKYNLYPDITDRNDRQAIADRMRGDIHWETVSIDPKHFKAASNDHSAAALALTVSYQAPTPELAQKVTDALASLYMRENAEARTEQAEQASQFLAQQAEQLGKKISGLEAKLAAFKQKHANELPDVATFNRTMLEQSQSQLAATVASIQSLEQRRIMLQGQLAQTPPNQPIYSETGTRVLTGTDRLSALKAQYYSDLAVYSSNHPDVIRLRREIRALESQLGGGAGSRKELSAELASQKAQLANLRQRYSDTYPDVVKLRKSIAELQKKLKAAPASAGHSAGIVPDNPAYIAVQAQVDAVNSDLQAQQAKKQELEKSIETYQRRLVATPAVEREYLAMTRAHEDAVKNYQQLQDKQMAAHLAAQLQREKQGDRFTTLQPASLPLVPSKPNRLGIMLLGTVLAFGGGIGSASLAEYRDRSVRGVRGVVRILQAPPLVVLPYIDNSEDRASRRKARLQVAVGGAALLIGMVALYSFSQFGHDSGVSAATSAQAAPMRAGTGN